MKVLFLLLIVVGLTNGKSFKTVDKTPDQLSNELIDYVNSLNTTWKAGKTFIDSSILKRFGGGTIKESRTIFKSKVKEINKDNVKINLPVHFDAREVWPNCHSISTIVDQGPCGTCWAVNTVSVMSDRHCIKSNGTINVQLSAEDVISCCSDCSLSCENGGYALRAFQYWIKNGIVTGGQTESEGCYPYKIDSCESDLSKCQIPACKRECGSWYNKKYTDDKYFGQSFYFLEGDEQIMLDLMTNGPISTRMELFGDIYNYKSGVYQHTVNDSHGFHTVKLIGWGTENGVDYWIAVNSWGTYWGDKGFFKIKRGDSIIGSDALTGLPKL